MLLAAAAVVVQPLDALVRAGSPSGLLRRDQWLASAGRGSGIALLGGMRSMVANGCWLQANLAWEKRDPVATAELIHLAVAADERPIYFWLNGARILANDLPEWRMAGPVPRSFRAVVDEAQAQAALGFLEQGFRWHGIDASLYVEMANIHLRRRHDLEAAARYYRLAAEVPGAPYFAARLHAEMLRALHRPAEALAWLRQVLPTLPVDDEAARRDVVVERIRVLEQELASP